VNISVTSDDTYRQFACSDNGIGIESQYAEKIFVIFQRLNPRDRCAGTGIGLAMCRKIIEYHGGRIWLDADGTSRASTLRFTLPKSHRPAHLPPNAAPSGVIPNEHHRQYHRRSAG
jgi:light-regulated signal transduction histidine kinase (bacteriophytochrome)